MLPILHTGLEMTYAEPTGPDAVFFPSFAGHLLILTVKSVRMAKVISYHGEYDFVYVKYPRKSLNFFIRYVYA